MKTVEYWSRTLIPTAREAPADAEVPSHVLLHRAGYIRPVGAGIYSYLPSALRVLGRISGIIREEMHAAGASELLMPALEPFEYFTQTRRDESYGDNLFRLKDRKGRAIALAPTHEEIITDMLKGHVSSYKQLPLSLYQIQTKFRDEARPRAGLLRGREFLMKDAYSFHVVVEGRGGLNETYDAMHKAYAAIFRRCGLDFLAVEAESGPIGGSASHEFMVRCASGEDTVLRCPVSGYAANVEKCEIGARPWSFDGGGLQPLKKHHTPGLPGIDAVAGVLGVTPPQMLKTIVFRVRGEVPHFVLAVVRGDHDVNEGKVKAVTGLDIALAEPMEAAKAGFAIGYVSPRVIFDPRLAEAKGLCKVQVLVDPDAAQGGAAWATGADEMDYHVTGFNWRREMEREMGQEQRDVLGDPGHVLVADIRNALPGDPSPRAAGSKLVADRGIEVGHIFKLGTKYSEAMGLRVHDEHQQLRPVIMGCYGIGISRTMAACVEMSHDENGIIWPAAIAPFDVLITVMKPAEQSQAGAADSLSIELGRAGLDVLIDDRDERPGVKFKDADLVGVPIRLTLGEKALAQGAVEFKRRTDAGKGELVGIGDVASRCLRPAN